MSQQIIGNKFNLWITDLFPLLVLNLKLLVQVEKKTGIGCKSRMLHIVLIESSMLKVSSRLETYML